MENDPHQQANPATKHPNKWLRIGRKILIGAIITWCINFILLKTGWDSWETFSKQADQFAETMMNAAAQLSPISLWKSITIDQKTFIIDDSSPYMPKYIVTGKVTFLDKIMMWLGYYWYTKKGNAFWVGRIILILAVVAGLGMAAEDYQKAKDKATAIFVLPFNSILKFFIFLMSLGILAILLYFFIKLSLAIVGGLVIIFSSLAACGGLVKFIVEESRNEVADSSKKTIATYLFPFLFRKRKTK